MTTQNPQVGGSMSAPQITMTRDLTKQASRPMGRKNQLMDYGDAESYDFGMAAGDQVHHDSHAHQNTQHTYSGEEHPVIVTGTSPDAMVSYEGGQYIVADSNSHTFFLDSKNDLDAARESNKYLQ